MPSSPTPKWSDLRSLPELALFSSLIKNESIFNYRRVPRSDSAPSRPLSPSTRLPISTRVSRPSKMLAPPTASSAPRLYRTFFPSVRECSLRSKIIRFPFHMCVYNVRDVLSIPPTVFPSLRGLLSVVNIDFPHAYFCLPYALFVNFLCARHRYDIINAIIARKMQLCKTDRSEIKDHSSRSARSRLFLHSGRSPSTWPLTLEIRLERGGRLWTKWPQFHHCHQMLSV